MFTANLTFALDVYFSAMFQFITFFNIVGSDSKAVCIAKILQLQFEARDKPIYTMS